MKRNIYEQMEKQNWCEKDRKTYKKNSFLGCILLVALLGISLMGYVEELSINLAFYGLASAILFFRVDLINEAIVSYYDRKEQEINKKVKR